jgi:hypothetical protein
MPLAITPEAAHPTIAIAAAGMPCLLSSRSIVTRQLISRRSPLGCCLSDQNATQDNHVDDHQTLKNKNI